MSIDPYRIETQLILGNLYSLQGNHDQAIIAFQRCVQMDPYYLSAWTLLGHEWLEKKNIIQAIKAYQMAVQLSPGEYRAWFGMGQAYESIKSMDQALFYYRKACLVKPNDPRIWTALASIYEAMDLFTEAKSCYQRAISVDTLSKNENANASTTGSVDMDARLAALEGLAKLYMGREDEDNAASCYELWIQELFPSLDNNIDDTEMSFVSAHMIITVQEAIEPCLFLANYHHRKESFSKAIYYARLLLEVPGPEKEEAKSILHQCQGKE